MRCAAVALAWFAIACRRDPAPPPATDRPAPATPSRAAADPWATPASTENARPPAERIRARVTELEPTLAKLRSLAFRQPVTVVNQTPAEFSAHMRTEIARDFPRPADTSAALFHLGLLPAKIDIAEAQRAFTAQASAYYDYGQKRFTILQSPGAPLFMDVLLVHELTHALQDQQFGLDHLLPASGLDADHVAARRFLVEGDAMFITLWFGLSVMDGGSIAPAAPGRAALPDRECGGGSIAPAAPGRAALPDRECGGRSIPPAAPGRAALPDRECGGGSLPPAVHVIRDQLDQLVRMSASEMFKQTLFGATVQMEPTVDTSLHALHEAPLTLVQPQFDAYFAGAQLVVAAFERGGWEAVEALYAHPPESTEQALHPATKLFSHPDPPVVLPIAVPADETVIDDRVFGELQWRVYFLLWAPNDNIVASQGWGGDHAVVTRLANGKLRARIATAWDSRSDADEFRRAYLASLVKRFPAGRGAADAAGGFDRGDGGGRIAVVQDGVRVTITDGP